MDIMFSPLSENRGCLAELRKFCRIRSVDPEVLRNFRRHRHYSLSQNLWLVVLGKDRKIYEVINSLVDRQIIELVSANYLTARSFPAGGWEIAAVCPIAQCRAQVESLGSYKKQLAAFGEDGRLLDPGTVAIWVKLKGSRITVSEGAGQSSAAEPARPAAAQPLVIDRNARIRAGARTDGIGTKKAG